MIDSSEYIYGYKFRELDSGDGSVVYADTHDLETLQNVFLCASIYLDRPQFKYTLITHNSDYAVSQAIPCPIKYFPANLVWYSTNVDIEHPNIRSIPIGLENPEWHSALRKSEKIANAKQGVNKVLGNAIFNPNTHPSRRAILEHFHNLYFCSAVSLNGSNFDHYVNVVKNSVFTVCPRGNGIDTHRLWEASYLCSIPIVEDCINIRQFEKAGLRMMVVPDLTKVTRGDLIDIMKFNKEKNDDGYRECLNMSYWINKIRNRM